MAAVGVVGTPVVVGLHPAATTRRRRRLCTPVALKLQSPTQPPDLPLVTLSPFRLGRHWAVGMLRGELVEVAVAAAVAVAVAGVVAVPL